MNRLRKLRAGPYRRALPDDAETALLRLVHAERLDAEACRQWLDRADLDNAHDGIWRLMPLLHKRMIDAGIDHGESGRLAGLYRHTRFRNRILLHRGEKLVRALEQLGIPALLLKGASLVLHPGVDIGTRPMADFDLLLPEDTDLDALLPRLAPLLDFTLETRIRGTVSYTYADNSGLEYDLHSHLRPKTQFAGSTSPYWQRSRPLKLGETDTKGLCAEHFVFHSMLHGLEHNAVSPLRWVSDVLFALEIDPQFDWDRLFSHAQRNCALEVILVATSYLVDKGFGVPGVQPHFEHWSRVRECWWIARYHRYRSAPFDNGRASIAMRFMAYFVLLSRLRGKPASPVNFVRFVQDHYGSPSGMGSLVRLVWRGMFAGQQQSREP